MVAIRALLDRLAAVAAGLCLAPVAPFLDRPVLLLACAAVVGGLWCGHHDRYPLHPLAATLLSLAGVAGYALQISRIEVATPVVHALVVLLAARLLTGKQSRDYLQIFVLALFILAGSSLLALEASFLLYLVLLVTVVTVSLMLLTVFVTDPRLVLPHRELWRLLRVALLMPAAALVLMLGFFVILPRTAHPLWNFLNPAGPAVAGLSESLNPGAFAELVSVKTPAFRAEVPELPPEQLYWRTIVLNQPEGNRWVRREPPPGESARIAGGRPLTLTIYSEPRRDPYLATLEHALLVGGVRSQSAADWIYRRPAAGEQRFRFTVQAALGGELRAGSRTERGFYLTVPARVSPRVAAAAAEIAARGTGSSDRLAALAAFFRERRLTYARDDLPAGPDPLEAFLFEKRRGYCEYFAAAYVTLARLAGLPARLVGGYYGGEYNALGGYYLVTEDAAHVWVEVLTDTGVWQRVDPSQWASNAGSTFGARRSAGLTSLQRLTDTVNYFWIQGVVVFDLNRQIELWREARSAWGGLRTASLRGDWLVLGGGLLVAGAALVVGLRRYRRRQSREARLVAALRARSRRRLGMEAGLESLTLGELAERLNSDACREFARIYQGAVFRDRRLSDAECKHLRDLLRRI